MQTLQEVSEQCLNEAPGYCEKRENTLAHCTKLHDLLEQRKRAKEREIEFPDELNIEVSRLSRQLKKHKRKFIDTLTAQRVEGLWDAWKMRRFYDAHKIARLLA
eukprot:2266204-Pyramimonas_sp.AAC.1